MTDKHTEGPFRILWEMGSGDFHYIVPVDQPDVRVAMIEAMPMVDGDMEEIGKANAHLFNAAQDLLEALEDLKEQAGKLPATQGEGWGRMVASLCGDEVAIAKARNTSDQGEKK